MAWYAKTNFSLDIQSTDFLKSDTPNEQYDMVVLWDVIEHLPHPEDFFKKIHAVLKKDGVVALTTGDIGSLMAKVQGPQWRLIHPPTHIHYFTRSSMIRFLKKYGFEVLHIQYPGYFRSIRQMLHGIFGQNKRIWNSLENSSWAGTPVYVNPFDIMQVVARKI